MSDTRDTPEAALDHRDDDQPCGCDDCMELQAEDNGINWWRLPKVDRERLRRNSSGDDRLTSQEKEHPMSHLFRSVRWTILAFIRSHDGSSPERPRRDGTYGWPHA